MTASIRSIYIGLLDSVDPGARGVAVAAIGAALVFRSFRQQSLGYGCDDTTTARLMRLELALGTYLMGVGIWQLVEPDSLGPLIADVAAVLPFLVVIGLLASRTQDEPSVSEAVCKYRVVRATRKLLRTWSGSPQIPSIPFARWCLVLFKWLGRAPLPGRVGPATTVLAFGLCGVVAANVPTAVRIATRPNQKQPKKPGPSRPSKMTAKAKAPAKTDPAPTEARTPAPLSYEDICGPQRPGRGAPAPLDRQLGGLWLGPDGAGALVAGCAGEPERVGQSTTWYSVGRCGDAVASLGVADGQNAPALLLGQAGRFALLKAEAGELRSATPRTPIRHGDFHIVQTSAGPYVLIRSRLTAPGADPALGCPPATSEPYVIVPPGLVAGWTGLAATEWAWPKMATSSTAGVSYEFVRPRDGAVVAIASCLSDWSCDVDTAAGVPSGAAAASPLTADALASLAG